MFHKCANRALRIGAWLTGGVVLAGGGCQVAESVLATLAAAWDIVAIWT